MSNPESLLFNPIAYGARFRGNILGVIEFDNNVNAIKDSDQFMLERYIIDPIHEDKISSILETRTTSKYLNDGVTVSPQDPEDGDYFHVTTGTYLFDFHHFSDIGVEVIPSTWSIRHSISDGFTEILDPEIHLNKIHMYRLTWVRDSIGYSTNYFLLQLDEPLPDLDDTKEQVPPYDDGGTIPKGIDGNPTSEDLGYGIGPGNPELVDELLLEDSWLDRCATTTPYNNIEPAPGFDDYAIIEDELGFHCPGHIYNRLNFRYRGTFEEEKIISYHEQTRHTLDNVIKRINNINSLLDKSALWLGDNLAIDEVLNHSFKDLN